MISKISNDLVSIDSDITLSELNKEMREKGMWNKVSNMQSGLLVLMSLKINEGYVLKIKENETLKISNGVIPCNPSVVFKGSSADMTYSIRR